MIAREKRRSFVTAFVISTAVNIAVAVFFAYSIRSAENETRSEGVAMFFGFIGFPAMAVAILFEVVYVITSARATTWRALWVVTTACAVMVLPYVVVLGILAVKPLLVAPVAAFVIGTVFRNRWAE